MNFFLSFNGPKKLHKVIEKFTLKKCSENNISQAEVKLILNWKSIVGKEIAEFVKPNKLIFQPNSNFSILQVLVTNSAMALNLPYFTPAIIEKITVFFGYKIVHSIKIKQKANILLET